MKQNATLILSSLFIGFFLGVSCYILLYKYSLDSFIKDFELSSVAETNVNLSYSKTLREGKGTDLVEHFESLVETNVLIFTDHGKALNDLSENDRCVFNKVKEYWENECSKSCFPKLKPIFQELDKRINIACEEKKQKPVHG